MAYNANTLPGAHGTGLAEDAYDSGRAHGLAQPTGLGLGQTQPHGVMKGGLTGSAGEVCDAPGVYNSANAVKTVHHVNDDRRERTYEPVAVEETVVHHDVERIKPVLHQEVHQTRLHEVTHHKVEPVRDLGVVEVVHHRDRDECGNVITGSLNAMQGGAGLHHGGTVENIKDKITGHHDTHATTGMTGTTDYKTDTAFVPAGPAVLNQTTDSSGLPHHHTTTTDHHTHGTTAIGADGHKVGGIKGLINKVVPGPGPF